MQTIYLEFRHQNGAIAANGTDTTFYIDGRWSWTTTVLRIHERVSALRSGPFGSRYSNQEFVGFTYSQQPFYNGKGGAIRTMMDPSPPAWACAKCKMVLEEQCCACSGAATNKIKDGAFVKPVCDQHARMYSGLGYVLLGETA